jgi:hypothetical protein
MLKWFFLFFLLKISFFRQVFCSDIDGNTLPVQDTQDDLTLQTNYVSVKYNKYTNVISSVSADFQGEKKFGQNLLSLPLQLEVMQEDGTQSEKLKLKFETAVFEHDEELTSLRHSVVMKATAHYENLPTIEQSMTITVDESLRSVEVLFDGKILRSFNASALTYSYYGNNPSIYGFYESGVVQMMGQSHACFGSNDKLERAYVLGGGSALDLLFASSSSGSAASSETVLISSTQAKDNYKTGIQYVLFGNYPNKAKEMSFAWNSLCWKNPLKNVSSIISINKDDSFHFNLTLVPNNYDFPVFLLNNIIETQDNIPFLDLRTSLTGIYGSAVGCLQSYYTNQIGIIAPTIAHPDIGYSPNTNFFDPDNFITLSAMLYSGDKYLISQVRNILQRTSQTMCGIGSDTIPAYCNQQRQRTKHEKMLGFRRYDALLKEEREMIKTSLLRGNPQDSWKPLYDSTSRSGQLMHHFIDLVPTYESIAGSEQLGPNIFWTMTVLKYLSLTQDNNFAMEIFPFIDLSCKYILSFIDNEIYMINAPGPLWIDVLIREQYTSDSNTMIIPFLDEMIQFYSYIDRLSTVTTKVLSSPTIPFKDFVMELQDLRFRIIESVNKYLWISNIPSSPKSQVNNTNDHFVTQLDTNLQSYRDFIDYDSNLMTIAFGIVTETSQIERILKRVDSGPFTHIRATWCSEIPYSGDADDCYIVGGSVCGDSVVTLARIGYIDAIARKVVGDLNTYQNLLLLPLQKDLISDVWLYERYDANGQQIRTSYYFEYPSLIAMMIREISYGIEVKLNEVIIHPFVMKSSFSYNIGNNFYVSFPNSNSIKIQNRQLLNQSNAFLVEKMIKVFGLIATASYEVSNSCDESVSTVTKTTDMNGLLQFSMKLVDDCIITIVKSST